MSNQAKVDRARLPLTPCQQKRQGNSAILEQFGLN